MRFLKNLFNKRLGLEVGEFPLAVALEDVCQLFDRVVLFELLRERLEGLLVLVLELDLHFPVFVGLLPGFAGRQALSSDLVDFVFQVLSELLELLLDSFGLRGLPGAELTAFHVGDQL